MDYILRTYGLEKQFKGKKVVDSVSINVRKGDIYGFLGQNSAGKTTTISMILGYIKPNAGEVELFGQEVSRSRKDIFERIGSIVDFPSFYPNLTACENLEIHRRLMGVRNKDYLEEALEITGLYDERNKILKNFSLGMKQRLGLAKALLHKPELLILDEPTIGLDPIGIKDVRSIILNLVQLRKTTVFMSSHILSEVAQLATRIGVIEQGKLLEEIDYEEIKMRNRHYIEIHVSNDKKASVLLEKLLAITDYLISEPGIIRIYEMLDSVEIINRVLVEKGLDVRRINFINDSLEDFFVGLTGGILHV